MSFIKYLIEIVLYTLFFFVEYLEEIFYAFIEIPSGNPKTNKTKRPNSQNKTIQEKGKIGCRNQ